MSMRDVVAAEVRANLARRRLSGRQAATRVGWTEMYLGRRLSAQVPFDVDDLEALGDLLELPVAAFFEQPSAISQATARGSRNQHLCRRALAVAA